MSSRTDAENTTRRGRSRHCARQVVAEVEAVLEASASGKGEGNEVGHGDHEGDGDAQGNGGGEGVEQLRTQAGEDGGHLHLFQGTERAAPHGHHLDAAMAGGKFAGKRGVPQEHETESWLAAGHGVRQRIHVAGQAVQVGASMAGVEGDQQGQRPGGGS